MVLFVHFSSLPHLQLRTQECVLNGNNHVEGSENLSMGRDKEKNWRERELPSLFIMIHVDVNKWAFFFSFKKHLLNTCHLL